MENILYKYCSGQVADDSAMGQLLMGPSDDQPAGAFKPALWRKHQLEKERNKLYLPNRRRPSVSCKQVSLCIATQIMHAQPGLTCSKSAILKLESYGYHSCPQSPRLFVCLLVTLLLHCCCDH